MRGRVAVALVALLALADACRVRPKDAPPFEPYLLVWAADADGKDPDFLAVISADRRSRKYGRVLRTVPVGSRGNQPFGVNVPGRSDGRLFATGLASGRLFLFDVRDPERAKLARVEEVRAGRGLTAPHSVVSLADGNALVSCPDRIRYRGDPREVFGAPGGLLALDKRGFVAREISAADEASRGFVVAPSGIAVAPRGGIVLTTNHAHGYAKTTQTGLTTGITVQVWREQGPTLEHIVVLEAGPRGTENLGPFTPRFLRRKPTALVNTHEGGALYVSDSMDSGRPAFRLVFDFGEGALPVGAAVTPDDRWYVTALAGRRRVVVLDVRDPLRPAGASSVGFDRLGQPGHLAMSADGERVAVADDVIDMPAWRLASDHRVHMLRLDLETGKLALDGAFRDEISDTPGVDFARAKWPHGATGPASPRGLVFVAEARPPAGP